MITTGTLETIDGRAALRFERDLAHPIERVWRAVSEPQELARWFVAPVHWTPRAGETFDAYGQRGEVIAVEPPRRLVWTFGPERFSFELAPAGEGCRLIFTHVLAEPALAAQHAAGWESYLDRLDGVLDGAPLTVEAAHSPIGELHERYAAIFELDPARGRRLIAGMAFRDLELADDGGVLRLERRYRHSVKRVWKALTDPAELAAWFPVGEPLVVTVSDPPRVLEGTWFGERLRFELERDGEGCRLVFTQEVSERDTAARSAAGWDRCFARFDALLAGAELSEAGSLELWPAVHERYAQAFGVDPEIGRRAYAAHPLT
jgi:uncharacterized protein YndB with AHSA1/START domain